MEDFGDEAAFGGEGFQSQNPNSTVRKRKLCMGYAYHSTVRKSKSKNPLCVGFSKTLREAEALPDVAGKFELDALKEGWTLADFKHACFGFSVHADNKDSSADSKDKTPKLPICYGYEMLFEWKNSSISPAGHVPAHAHKMEVGLLYTCNGASDIITKKCKEMQA